MWATEVSLDLQLPLVFALVHQSVEYKLGFQNSEPCPEEMKNPEF